MATRKTTAKPAGKRSADKKSAAKSAKPKATPPRHGARSKRTAAPQGGGRPVWSGNLRLALVMVPVNIYPATKSGARISFHQVHKPSGKRIRYEKVVPGLGAVDADEIVKGYEISKGHYVLLEPDEVDAVKLEAKKTLDLIQFVKQGDIDPIWFERPYYVVAEEGPAEEAYAVLRDALRSSGRIGLGQFVMRGREYIGALKPCGKGILLETLRFADEVSSAAPYFAEMDVEKPDSELLNLATELIDRKSAPFDPKKFEDKYTEALQELIERKRKGKAPVEIDEEEAPSGGAKVIDLVEVLKRSVRSAESGRAKAAPKRKAG
ncbi:non-homologous end joining protein Ku [Dongia rigui]|uniref:Non-homologous end joining protein Ku n=1 Tax=Dongia rigui TaxID=940149 RepID=A0ABU5DVT3_9PROT|nr:Ku protein [Dongia rigui]MDY0871087.1 Ku protein [Dongia rigui]